MIVDDDCTQAIVSCSSLHSELNTRIMRSTLFVIFELFGCWQCVQGAKILAFFPAPFKSHHFVFTPLLKELAINGHQVDYYTPIPTNNAPEGLTQFITRDWKEEVMKDFDGKALATMSPFTLQRIITIYNGAMLEKTLTHDQVCIDLLRSNRTYDLVLTEFPVGNEPTVYFAHKFKALSVAILPFPDYPWANELAGFPDNPSYMESDLNPVMGKLNFWQRIYNTYVTSSIVLAGYYDLYATQTARADRIMTYDGCKERPKLSDMMAETALILTNSHPSTSPPYPKAPHVKEIAGIHLDPNMRRLPQELKDFMDDGPKGVIFFSLGSVLDPAELLADGKFDVFLRVFRKLKLKVMWKVAPGLPDVEDPLIKVQTWYPQQGVLEHKNLKMFITHGGLQSTIEAISFAVPCLGIPFYFDQQKNVAFMEKVGMAISLKLEEISEIALTTAIQEILNNPKYRDHAIKQKAVFEDRPRKPLDEAVYWVEYVLKHGQILRPASATMPLYQLYLIDVIAAVVTSTIVILWLMRKVLRIVLSRFGKSNKGTGIIKKKMN